MTSQSGKFKFCKVVTFTLTFWPTDYFVKMRVTKMILKYKFLPATFLLAMVTVYSCVTDIFTNCFASRISPPIQQFLKTANATGYFDCSHDSFPTCSKCKDTPPPTFCLCRLLLQVKSVGVTTNFSLMRRV